MKNNIQLSGQLGPLNAAMYYMSMINSKLPPMPDFLPGTVWLAGAGPGEPGLLTLLAMHGLHCADVVVYDALVNERILTLARNGAELIYAGKRGGRPSYHQRDISQRLVELANDSENQ